jgi:preprotein translocase subunit SecA
VIYTRRRNALFGDRIQVDLDNMIYDECEALVAAIQPTGDAEQLRMESIRLFAYDPAFSPEELDKLPAQQLSQQLYEGVSARYQQKAQRLAQHFYAQVQEIHSQQPQYKMIEVSMSDRKRVLRMHLPIAEVLETEGYALMTHFEKGVVLNIIDEAWKEHLREMDDLKQSVQTAVYEQKDPVLIYKFEAFELFQQMLKVVNEKVSTLLHRGELEGQEGENDYVAQREDFSRMRAQHANAQGRQAPQRVPVGIPVGGPDGEERKISRRERRAQERKQK